MRQTLKVKTTMAVLSGAFVLSVSAAAPTISNVSVHQRWPWSRLVDIDYTLTCDDSNRVDVTITAYNSVTPLTLPSASLSGDVDSVLPGTRRIVWDPSKTAYTNELLTQFRVDLTPALAPAYMIVDLTDGQKSYRYDWNTVWYDVTNHTEYMTTNLVLRRVPAGTFLEGSPTSEPSRGANEDRRQVTLTKGYYIGVFEVTQKQWALLMNNAWPSWYTNEACKATRPVERISCTNIRGNSTNIGVVATGSFMEKLKTLTGLTVDLPTEAQWEYACRAGTATPYNDGLASPTLNTVLKLARSTENSGGYTWDTSKDLYGPEVDDSLATARVGSYVANAWGLYDMHGNVWEQCVDRYLVNWGTTTVIDPAYFDSTSIIPIRGNGFREGWGGQRSARRSWIGYSSPYDNVGFRVWVALP